jgi:hypothetical protein
LPFWGGDGKNWPKTHRRAKAVIRRMGSKEGELVDLNLR